MEKKLWTRPTAHVEQFMPNEYVAACYSLYCNLPFDSNYVYETVNGVTHARDPEHTVDYCKDNWLYHSSNACGDPAHQVLRNGVMYEWSVGENDWLECTFTGFDPTVEVPVGGTVAVEWSNSSGSKTWNHDGYLVYDARPLHS